MDVALCFERDIAAPKVTVETGDAYQIGGLQATTQQPGHNIVLRWGNDVLIDLLISQATSAFEFSPHFRSYGIYLAELGVDAAFGRV